jgi:hypothetical protein
LNDFMTFIASIFIISTTYSLYQLSTCVPKQEGSSSI